MVALVIPWALFGGLALWLLGQGDDWRRVARGVGLAAGLAVLALVATGFWVETADEATCGAVLSAVGAGGGSGGWISLHCLSLLLLSVPVIGSGACLGLAVWAFGPGGPGRPTVGRDGAHRG